MTVLFKGIALLALLTTTALVTPSFAQSGDQVGAGAQSGDSMKAGQSGGMESGGSSQTGAATGDNQTGAGTGDNQTGGNMGGKAGAGAGAATCDEVNTSPDCPPAGGVKGQRGAEGSKDNMRSEEANPKSDNDRMQNDNQVRQPSEKSTQESGTRANESDNGSKGSNAGNMRSNDETGGNTSRNTAGASAKSTTNVNISVEQKTEIRQQIKKIDVAPVSHVDFNVSVGVAVPKTVHLRPLPARIATLVPDYRGFLFFVLADGRIVIVDPHSLEIVLIIA